MPWPRSTFARRLVLVWLLGLAIRIAYAIVQRRWPVIGDALTFHLEGGFLADGEGFRRAFEDVPTAEHAPGMTVVVAALDLLGLDSTSAQKIGLAVLGSATVPLIGLVGRQAAGPRAGLIAALVAAGYPMLWAADGALMSETVYGVLIAASLWLAYRALERPTGGRFAALGAVIALAALTRGEAIGLLVVLVAPLAWRVRSWERGVAALAAFALVLAPWTIRNLATFEEPVLISTNSYGIWVGANCHETYYGELIGSWVFSCYGKKKPPGDEVQESIEYRKRGMRYARDHIERVPLVVAARAGRLLDVHRPWSQGVFLASAEGRRPGAQRLGLVAWWILAPLAAAGAVVLRRRRAPLVVLLAPIVLVVLVGLTTYGSTRFRFAAEPAVVVLAAVALDALLRRRERPRAPAASPRAAAPPA